MKTSKLLLFSVAGFVTAAPIAQLQGAVSKIAIRDTFDMTEQNLATHSRSPLAEDGQSKIVAVPAVPIEGGPNKYMGNLAQGQYDDHANRKLPIDRDTSKHHTVEPRDPEAISPFPVRGGPTKYKTSHPPRNETPPFPVKGGPPKYETPPRGQAQTSQTSPFPVRGGPSKYQPAPS